MKITRTTEKLQRGLGELTRFFADGIEVVTVRKYKEWFCTIGKGGSPSNIRDRIKTAYETKWNRTGLAQIIGDNDFEISYSQKTSGDFRNDYPDTTWGHPGSNLTNKRVKELIEMQLTPKKD